MRYYCSVCKETITKGEFQYSMDKFSKALCRNHQNHLINDNKQIEEDIEIDEDIVEEETSIKESVGWKSFVKKVAVKTGKGIAKGTKVLADTTKKTIQTRTWKDKILRRMSGGKVKQLAREKRIRPSFIEKPKVGDYIGAIKNRVSLNEIIAFAKRNKINIRDILTDIEQTKAHKELLELKKEGKDINEFYLEVIEAIHSFEPFRRYKEELPYQIDLARWLQSKFPNTKIEETRGSTRPDIVIKGIAIEVKGPTSVRDLQTVSDKCMRYQQYYPQGMIVVLFDVWVNQFRYKDWLKGMKRTHPDVVVVKI